MIIIFLIIFHIYITIIMFIKFNIYLWTIIAPITLVTYFICQTLKKKVIFRISTLYMDFQLISEIFNKRDQLSAVNGIVKFLI